MPQKKIGAAGSCVPAVKGILLDLDGVVYVGETVLPGSPEAVSQIQAAARPWGANRSSSSGDRGKPAAARAVETRAGVT